MLYVKLECEMKEINLLLSVIINLCFLLVATQGQQCIDVNRRFKLSLNGSKKKRSCYWAGRNEEKIKERCAISKVRKKCPVTCDSCPTPTPSSTPIMYEIIGEKLYHDESHFTQGLTYSKESKTLFESNGLFGHSSVCKLNPITGEKLKCNNMDSDYFGEGMQVYGHGYDEKLIQLTWKSRNGFIYNATTLDKLEQFEFSSTRNEGWGISLDEANNEFIVSDGSNYLHFWDVDTLKETRRLEVMRLNGQPATHMNELEFVNGKVLANIWYEDVIIVIDPITGQCEIEYDFSKLWPIDERNKENAGVLNGISMSEDDGIFYVTGKKWNRMFRVKLLGLSK